MNVLDLFSGIGGFSLGLERAGMKTVAFCEIEPFCRRVLDKHWPGVPIYEDVRTLTIDRLRSDGIVPDVICGGFPCQDISVAGKGAGIDGERSGLWSEYARIIGEVRPRYIIVENVAALLGRGLDRVLGDLASLGFDAEWHCIPASAVGAPHRRDRLWLVAYARCMGFHQQRCRELEEIGGFPCGEGDEKAIADSGCGEDVANANHTRLEGWLCEELRQCASERTAWPNGSYAEDNAANGERTRRGVSAGSWRTEPDMGRVAHGVPSRVDRLWGLGNAVVPQIPELIGRAIMRAA